MTIEAIFSNVRAHMIRGLMLHDQMATIYSFLNLCGYQKCHEYHYYEESHNYRCLQNFYLDYYHKMIPDTNIDSTSIIPTNWYKYTRKEVDTNTKRNAIKEMMQKWVEWEQDTRALLQSSFKELYEQGEICAASKIKEFLEDVCCELKCAQSKFLNLESEGYDIVNIISEQPQLSRKYIDQMHCLYRKED